MAKMTAAQDQAYDKAHGIALGSAADRKLDKERGVDDDDGPKYGRKRKAGKRAKGTRSVRGMNMPDRDAA